MVNKFFHRKNDNNNGSCSFSFDPVLDVLLISSLAEFLLRLPSQHEEASLMMSLFFFLADEGTEK